MMLWALVVLVALMIPLTAVILDSPVVRAWAERRHPALPGPADGKPGELERKVETLENEIEAVNRELLQLKESQQFIQRVAGAHLRFNYELAVVDRQRDRRPGVKAKYVEECGWYSQHHRTADFAKLRCVHVTPPPPSYI